ncbi:Amino acid permease 6 [Zostera marina]|uniref:Amino acid permease 6 n=1 Tax=Zostera marina TaxID=29655 RepID=A0A0K9PQF2_ZOSMR|nr:Amino acid permease 6 [Zostera marina]
MGSIRTVGEHFDEDGRQKRTGTLMTASAHIITAVIGSGVLSLAWGIAQLGWVSGPVAIIVFSIITYFTSTLLADCYRSPDPVSGKRNYTYMDVVRSHLGGINVTLCGLAQYCNLFGITIGYAITGSISMAAVQRSNCFYGHGHQAKCKVNNNGFMITFGCFELLLSQMQNFHQLWWLSIVAAVMSLVYSTIALGLSISKITGGGDVRTSLSGVTIGVDVTSTEKIWKTFQAVGDIAFSYAFSTILIEIQDTLKSSPPENGVMKKASLVGVFTTTLFYVLCGSLGYAAFGNVAPGNILTGFGFYDPFWLIDIGNICILIHLIGAYQVFCQPIFQHVETQANKRWPDSSFINKEYVVKLPILNQNMSINLFRLVWRSIYVIMTTVIAMILPFFNDFLGLLGACSFWPLTVYFPIEMHITKENIPKWSFRWLMLRILTLGCFIVCLVAAAGSIRGLVQDVEIYKPFRT